MIVLLQQNYWRQSIILLLCEVMRRLLLNSSVYFLVSVSIAFFCFVFLFFDKTNNSEYYRHLYFLPLAFFVSSVIAWKAYNFLLKKVSVTFIIGLYFVRMVIIPVIIALSGYTININIGKEQIIPDFVVGAQMTKAILLMCYEVILVFILLSGFKFNTGSFFEQKISSQDHSSILFKEIFFSIVLFCLIFLIFFPELLNYTEFFISDPIKTDYRYARGLILMKKVTPSIIYWLYLFFVNLLQVFIPIFLVKKINGRLYKRRPFIAIFLSFIVLLSLFAIMTPEKATSVQLALSLFLILCVLYPKSLKIIAPISIVSLLVLAIFALLIKVNVFNRSTDVNELYANLSSMLNAYFGGPANVATSLCIEEKISISVVIADFFQSIPFVGYFFKDMQTTPKIFNALIHSSEATYLIVPMIGQGWFYLGTIFAPVISVIVAYFALWFERRADRTHYIIKKFIYLYAAILLSMAPVMYNINIFISSLWNILFCLFFMSFVYTRLYSNGKLKYRL